MKKGFHVQFNDSSSILIINSKGIIRQLQAPFKVQCSEDTGRYKKGVFLYVEEVAAGDNDQLIYFIGDAAYYHRCFRIVANF